MSDDVVYHSDSGITEGVAPVPRWYFIAVALLSLGFVIYLGRYLVDAQPSTARIRKDTPPAVAPETPAADGDEAGAEGA